MIYHQHNSLDTQQQQQQQHFSLIKNQKMMFLYIKLKINFYIINYLFNCPKKNYNIFYLEDLESKDRKCKQVP